MNVLTEIKSRLESFGINSSITEGDGTEFGEPNRLIIQNPRDTVIHEVDTKIGNSWYFPNCGGVRLVTYGPKLKNSEWFNYQFRLIDQDGDVETCWKWFERVFKEELNPELSERIHHLGGKLTNLGKKVLGDLVDVENGYLFKVRTPKIQYTLVNQEIDEIKDYQIVDITLPYPSKKEQMSLIIQACVQTGDLRYSFRALTKSDMPDLIRFDLDKEIEEDQIYDLLKNWKLLVKDMYF